MPKLSFRATNKLCKALFFMLTMSLLLTGAALAIGSDDIPELPASDGSSYTPEIDVKMLDGNEMKLSSLRGKVVMLDFFWTKCPHCQEHAPHVAELYSKYKDRGLVILGLATDYQTSGDLKGSTAEVKAFVKQYKLPYLVGFSSIELVAYFTDSHNRGVPQMVLFGTDGKMTLRRIGWDEKVSKEIQGAIEAQLGKTASVAPIVKPGSKAVQKARHKRTVSTE